MNAPTCKIIQGDSRVELANLPEKSVHCCITSIPYWGLRSYLPADHSLKPLEIGAEPTFDLYLDHISEVFKAVHRVLRDDGTIWVNVGDAYARDVQKGQHKPGDLGKQDYIITDGGGKAAGGMKFNITSDGSSDGFVGRGPRSCARLSQDGFKQKDLLMMPARVAMRLQADGWYLRSQIPWIKRNAMPESVTDRPATACEYVYLLSKSQTYYYDRYAVMMKSSPNTNARLSQDVMNQIGSEHAHAGGKTNGRMKAVGGKVAIPDGTTKSNASFEGACCLLVSARNRRNSDWFMESWQGLLTDPDGEPLAFIVNPKGTSIKHFACYPPKLVEPMVKAATSEKGCCPLCGAAWARLTQEVTPTEQVYGEGNRDCFPGRDGDGIQKRAAERPATRKTLDWKPSCQCVPIEDTPDAIPCTALDPFGGSGTTAQVAMELGRSAIIVELNPEYITFSEQRTDVTPGLALA